MRPSGFGLVVTFITMFVSSFGAPTVRADDPPPSGALQSVVDKIVARETQEMQIIRQRSPLVETYIQKVRSPQDHEGWQPDGDRYFIGRADLPKDFSIQPLAGRDDNPFKEMLAKVNHLFNFKTEFLPNGFLQMIYPDLRGLDTQSYHFAYARREFLGEVRTLVFDVQPAAKDKRGRFLGRIWVEDQGFTIVRFNGTYETPRDSDYAFHFDSWRVNCGPNLWLPAFIYSEENTPKYPLRKAEAYRAQTRLWGYGAGYEQQEQELSQVLIESTQPVVDRSSADTDRTPLQQQRAWDAETENNVIDKLQRMGLIAPKGEVDKILDTVINNLEVTNNLDPQPEIQCRVLMTSTLESFSVGHTIVLSRGLIDVLPDEASLAMILAKEIGIVLQGHKPDKDFAFYDRLLHFDEKAAFLHFNFMHASQDDVTAGQKAVELLKNSPYKDQLKTPENFIAELQQRAAEIPNLISPRLGDAKLLQLPVTAASPEQSSGETHIVSLPVGGRVKIDPWSDRLELLKSQTVGAVSEREKMPFEITPFVIYLTRVGGA